MCWGGEGGGLIPYVDILAVGCYAQMTHDSSFTRAKFERVRLPVAENSAAAYGKFKLFLTAHFHYFYIMK